MNLPTRCSTALMAIVFSSLLSACEIVPEPLSPEAVSMMANDRAARIVQEGQEPVSGNIDLYEAMARALKYNLDQRVDMKEQALRIRQKDVVEFDMLPDLVAEADYLARDNEPGATSVSLITGNPSLEPSRSTEESVLDANLTLTWDILDFGLSYVRAQQAADEALIAMEQRRSTINRVIEDVRSAYWRVVSAQRLLRRLNALERRAQTALTESEAISEESFADPLDALQYQRDLLLVIRAAQELERDLSVAKSQLAALMNLAPGTDFSVVIPRRAPTPPPIRASLDELLRLAYRNRPELREISYEQRINDREMRISELETLPSPAAVLGINTSSNDLLYNQDWVTYGARLSWDLLNLARLPRRKAAIAAGSELLDARALALTRAVATQVVVSKTRYDLLREELSTASRYDTVSAQILSQVKSREETGEAGEQTLIKEELEAILAELRHDLSYVEAQTAYANLYSAIGLDPYAPGVSGKESVADLARSLRDLWKRRQDVTAAARGS